MSGQDLNLKIRLTGDGSDLSAEIIGVEKNIDKMAAGAASAGSTAAAGIEKATAATMTWHALLKERMGPLMKKFAAEGKSHAEAHTLAIRQISAEWKQYKATGVRANQAVGQSSERATSAISKTKQGVQSISKQLGRMQRIGAAAFAFVGISSGVRGLIHMSDTFTSLNAQLATASSNTRELRTAQSALQRIARETRGSWEATVTVYARMARATKELGVPQQDLLTVTKALNQAVTVSGATSTEASNALIQLSQGMASGTLRGDELRSVLEQIPRVGQAIAKGMGISFGQLRQLGTEGKITTQQIIAALKSQSSVLQAEFNKMPPTVGAAAQQVSDAMTQLWGEFTTTSGAATGLANSILFAADHLKAIASGALVAAKVAAIGFAGKLALVTIEANTATLSLVRLRTASLGLFMLYRTGGVRALLTAPFIGMAAATKTAFAGIGMLRIASGVLFAAYAGWQIGTYLSDQFAIVRQAGVAMVAGLIKGWTYIKSAFELMSAGISIAWDTMIVGLKRALGSFLSFTSSALDALPFMDGVAASVKGYATQLQHAQGPLETFAAAQKRINDERDRTIAQQDKILASMFMESGKPSASAAPASGGGVPPRPPRPSPPSEDPSKKLFSSAASLTSRLRNAYKTSFERISEQYAAMFDKLEALGKPGEKRLEALADAYGKFMEARWQKQEDKRKAILSRGVDAIAESLMSEDERQAQAYERRKNMLQQAIDDEVITKKRGLNLLAQLEKKHADAQHKQDMTAMQVKMGLVSQVFGGVAALMQSGSEKAFRIGKTAAIAQAGVNGISAAIAAWDKGMQSGGIWAAVAMTGASVLKTGTMIAKLESTRFGGGGASVSAGGASFASGGGGAVTTTAPVTFNPGRQRPTTPPVGNSASRASGGTVIHIVQHINAPNSQPGQEQALATVVHASTQQALAAVGHDFSTNGPLRQQLAV